jgi:hypothetical protein
MENEHVLGGLTRKRAEIAGQIEHAQAALRKLVEALDVVDAAIRIFDPEADLTAIRPRQYPPRHQAFRGEMMRHVMECLRTAKAPVTNREIAVVVMKARGLNPEDGELLVTIRKRVGACMFKLKQQGVVREVAGVGDLKEWRLRQVGETG